MEYTYNLKVIKTKAPTDPNWVFDVSVAYSQINGRVYDIRKTKDEERTANGTIINYGYYTASAELSSLPNPFLNPITNSQVSVSKIEASFEDTNGWDTMTSTEIYFEYLAQSSALALEEKYSEIFGLKIKLRATKNPQPSTAEAISGTPSTTVPVEIAAATASASGASASGATASNIEGEFTFNVEQENMFMGNTQFGTLYIIGIGEVKEEPIDMPSEETLDEEYQEGSFAGLEEEPFVKPDEVVFPDNRATSPDFVEDEQASNIPVESISGLPAWSLKLTRKSPGEKWEAHAANYISRKEGFIGTAAYDENRYRMGFGSDKILKGGKLTEVFKGDKCTLLEATETLASYGIPNFSKTIAKAIGSPYWENLTPYQKAALVSLGYNVGQYYITARGYGRRIKAAIVEGNMTKAAQEILNGPATASGKLLRPLKERRKEEAQLFLQPSNKSIYK